MPDKSITGWLVVDWKNGSHRSRKSKPGAGDLGKNELLAKINVDIHVPEVDVPALSLEIDVPEPQVRAATLEALDEDDLPDWTDRAAEVVGDHQDRIDAADGPGDRWGLVNELTTEVLTSIETRPDAEHVRDYVNRLAFEAEEAEA